MESTTQKSYWASVILAGILFGIIEFALQIGGGYYQIHSQGTFSYFSIFGTLECLLPAFAGMLAVWNYIKENEINVAIGRGAVIGLITGLVVAAFGFILLEMWKLIIDPQFTTKLTDATIESLRSSGKYSDTQMQTMSDMMHKQGGLRMILQFVFGFIISGTLNLLTGMLGAKLFSKEEKQTL